MALIKETEVIKTEIAPDGIVRVVTCDVIYEDGVEISRSKNHRETFDPDNTELSEVEAKVSGMQKGEVDPAAIVRQVWTPEVVAKRKATAIELLSRPEG